MLKKKNNLATSLKYRQKLIHLRDKHVVRSGAAKNVSRHLHFSSVSQNEFGNVEEQSESSVHKPCMAKKRTYNRLVVLLSIFLRGLSHLKFSKDKFFNIKIFHSIIEIDSVLKFYEEIQSRKSITILIIDK